jgi:chaperonin GroEL
VEEGIIPGGGVALLRAQDALDKLKLEGGQSVGVNILRRALEAPIRQICENAGAEASIVVQNVRDGKGAYGFDARDESYVDMFEAGIIDPTKVARVAVENACSIAGMILITEAAVTEIPEKEASMPPMGDPGMGGMGGMM